MIKKYKTQKKQDKIHTKILRNTYNTSDIRRAKSDGMMDPGRPPRAANTLSPCWCSQSWRKISGINSTCGISIFIPNREAEIAAG